MVEPMNAIMRCRPAGMAPRSCSKSPTNGAIRSPGYRCSSAAVASASTVGSTSNGMNSRSVPASRMARSSRPVLADVPLPSSTSDSQPDRRAISPARAARISVSALVR